MIAVWIEASRPKTLICSASPILIGSLLAYQTGTFSLLTCLITLLAGLSIQILTNWANDYFDFVKGADTTERKGPRRVTQAGLVSLAQMKRALILLSCFAAALGIYLVWSGGPFIGLAYLCMLLLAFGYTAGPLPLAYRGLGELFVLLFFGPIATLGTYFLQTHHFSLIIAGLGFSPACMATAIIALNNLRDIDEDRKAEKKTLAVRFGKTFGRLEYTFFLVTSCLLPCFFGAYLPLLALIPAYIPLKAVWKTQDFRQMNIPFAQTGKLMILLTLLLCGSIFI
jgi:1,4-dihydroxy-2-naphthoate polyprenyltransferase